MIVGAGHNGLVCACYLAQAGPAGRRVRAARGRGRRRGDRGIPSRLPQLRGELHGEPAQPEGDPRPAARRARPARSSSGPFSNFLPLRGRPLPEGRRRRWRPRSARSRNSRARDAERLPAYYDRLERVADVLRDLLLETPPNVGGGIARAVSARGRRRGGLNGLALDAKRDVLDLFTMAAGDWLERWFESEPIKACFGFDSVVGNFASPWSPGTAYVLLHHVFGEVNGKKGTWGHADRRHGRHHAGDAPTRRWRAAWRSAPVSRSSASSRRAGARRGSRSPTAPRSRARCVVANAHPEDRREARWAASRWPEAFANYQCESATFRMNVALVGAAGFLLPAGQGGRAAPLARESSSRRRSPTWTAPTRRAREQGWSREPDRRDADPEHGRRFARARRAAHVASLFCQHFRYALPGGTPLGRRARARGRRGHRPRRRGTRRTSARAIIARRILSPLDLEREFGLVGGDIFHGKLTLNQLFSARPVLGHGNYRMPLAGLYLCGSGAHPGGGVTGVPGHNAAREVAARLARCQTPCQTRRLTPLSLPVRRSLLEERGHAFLGGRRWRNCRRSCARHPRRPARSPPRAAGRRAPCPWRGCRAAWRAACWRGRATVSMRRSAGDTRFTRPQSSAVSASMKSPVKSISAARLRPRLRDSGTAGVEQKSPRLTPGDRESRVVACHREVALRRRAGSRRPSRAR